MSMRASWRQDLDLAESQVIEDAQRAEAIEREQRDAEQMVLLEMTGPNECERCGIPLGIGRGLCRRAMGTNICLDCAIYTDPPVALDADDTNTRAEQIADGIDTDAWSGGFSANH